MKKVLVVANWKATPASSKEALKFVLDLKKVKKKNQDVVICSPSVFIDTVKKAGGVVFGAQDVSVVDGGSFTGEVTASMLKSLGVRFCIVGHSERRKMGETGEAIGVKIKQLLKNGIIPIVCIGESLRGSDGEHFKEIARLIQESLVSIPKKSLTSLVLAYEPLWAISTQMQGGIDPEALNETILFIRKELNDFLGAKIASSVRIIYGGSVDQKNVTELLTQGGAEGLLIGKASQKIATFQKIIEKVNNL